MAAGDLAGAVNACAPAPARNAHFAAALGAAMHRPSLIPLPEAVVRAVFGEMGEETLLASQRAVPAKLLASGFRFLDNTNEEGCVAAFQE
jgi:NAD dependent epimerase/dehydratase family enzyme